MKSKNKRKRRGEEGEKGRKGYWHNIMLYYERERERVIVIPNELSRD